MEPLLIPDTNRRWDCLSLGEVMLRFEKPVLSEIKRVAFGAGVKAMR